MSELQASSWRVLVIWTCETRNKNELQQKIEAFMLDRCERKTE
jgi:G:T-mismatch repair DNA endonuclease (very short patch repair protein)